MGVIRLCVIGGCGGGDWNRVWEGVVSRGGNFCFLIGRVGFLNFWGGGLL